MQPVHLRFTGRSRCRLQRLETVCLALRPGNRLSISSVGGAVGQVAFCLLTGDVTISKMPAN